VTRRVGVWRGGGAVAEGPPLLEAGSPQGRLGSEAGEGCEMAHPPPVGGGCEWVPGVKGSCGLLGLLGIPRSLPQGASEGLGAGKEGGAWGEGFGQGGRWEYAPPPLGLGLHF